jgi:hypothetical protein
LQITELEPFVEDWYTVEGIGTPPDLHKAFFVWNDLWKVDYKTRKRGAGFTGKQPGSPADSSRRQKALLRRSMARAQRI